ncbi:putative reverse transcriptase domain-containing protein, partial [Tanacetum coccineum]
KQLIAELSMLAAPMEKEELIVYLAATKETVSTVLMTEREAKQMPIYFVSMGLKGPAMNYISMEKLVLALVHAKEDSLDTLMEVEEELPEPCILFTDGSSCTDGSGAGLILTNPEFTYALRFRFDATNNEAITFALSILYRVDGGDFYEICDDLRFIVINNPFWKEGERVNGLVEVKWVEDLGKVSNRGNVGNQNGNVVNKNIQENVGNVIVNSNRVGCSYKEFLACNPKEYDGKGGVVVLTRWIEKMEYVHDMSGCSIYQKVKYTAGSFVEFCPSHEMQTLESELWNHAMVGVGHAAYTDRFHELARMVAATEPKTIQKAVQISGTLTDEAVRNGSIKKVEKRENVGELSKDKNGKDDNKRTMTGNAFATTVNPVGRENTGTWPKCTICNSYHAPGGPCRTCFNCNRPGHLAKDYEVVTRPACPRLNRARGPEENRPNQVAANNGGQGRGNQGNQARGRAFMLGAEEARQDPNIVTGTFTLNDHFATTLFDSGAVLLLLCPLGQLVEIDKVIKGCKLEIEGHVFDIDLIPFGHGSFDVIIGLKRCYVKHLRKYSFLGMDKLYNGIHVDPCKSEVLRMESPFRTTDRGTEYIKNHIEEFIKNQENTTRETEEVRQEAY